MYFYLFRILILLAVFIVPLILAIKNRKAKRFWFLIITCFILLIIISSVPIENLFYSFDTPEDALAYQYSRFADTVIQGEESCLVYYKTDSSTYTHAFFKKDNGKYKLSYYMEGRTVGKHQSIDGIWQIYRFGKTDDYYLSGTWYDDAELRLTQNGVDIPIVVHEMGKSPYTDICFVNFYHKNFNEDTALYVNDNLIEFK